MPVRHGGAELNDRTALWQPVSRAVSMGSNNGAARPGEAGASTRGDARWPTTRNGAAGAGGGGVRTTPGFPARRRRSEEHTSELQSLMRIPYAVICLKNKNKHKNNTQ